MKLTSTISTILTSILLKCTTALTASGGPSYPINVEPHNYTDSEGVLLQGFLSRPSDENTEQASKLPAVIVVHDRDGPDTYEQQRATLLADELGYVGFVADIFGYGVVLPDDGQGWDGARGEFVRQYSSNATLFASRIQAAVDYVRGLEYVDEAKVAIVGYCFGGTGVVHYLNARGNTTDVAGVCAVHPSLLGDWGGPVVESIDLPALFLTGGSDFLTGPEASECGLISSLF
jgi:dienelactone hydrolase